MHPSDQRILEDLWDRTYYRYDAALYDWAQQLGRRSVQEQVRESDALREATCYYRNAVQSTLQANQFSVDTRGYGELPLQVTYGVDMGRYPGDDVEIRIFTHCELLHRRGPWEMRQRISMRDPYERDRFLEVGNLDTPDYVRLPRFAPARAQLEQGRYDNRSAAVPHAPCTECGVAVTSAYQLADQSNKITKSGLCHKCYDAGKRPSHAAGRLVDICKVVNNVVVARAAAIVDAWTAVRGLHLLGAHLLWEHGLDDFQKRAALLELDTGRRTTHEEPEVQTLELEMS